MGLKIEQSLQLRLALDAFDKASPEQKRHIFEEVLTAYFNQHNGYVEMLGKQLGIIP